MTTNLLTTWDETKILTFTGVQRYNSSRYGLTLGIRSGNLPTCIWFDRRTLRIWHKRARIQNLCDDICFILSLLWGDFFSLWFLTFVLKTNNSICFCVTIDCLCLEWFLNFFYTFNRSQFPKFLCFTRCETWLLYEMFFLVYRFCFTGC